MIGQDHSHAEPEAICLLRALVEGIEGQTFGQAHAEAKRFLRLIAAPNNLRPSGGQLTRVTPDHLREIARRAPHQTKTQIARALGMSRDLVQHHLTPSKAMRAACAVAPEASPP